MLLPRLFVLALAFTATSLASNSSAGPFWFTHGALTEAGRGLLQEIAAIERRGLRPADYDNAELRRLAALVRQSPTPDLIARADAAFTAAAARVAADLQRGRISPTRVGYEVDIRPSTFDSRAAVASLATSHDVSASLDALEPQMRHYALLKRSLASYRELAQHPELTRLPALPGRSVKPGNSYSGMPELRRLLTAMGDLSSTAGAAPNGSGIPVDRMSVTLDPASVAALAHFQMRVGVEPDGVLGAKTFQALTTPFARRVEQIELSLERVRWLPRTLDTPPIIVNIPQFRLFAFRTPHDFAADILQMNVIVGATFEGRETPVFAAQMRYVVLNPYWDVPFSIMRRELLPEIEADAEWVARNGFQIVAGPGDDAAPLPVTEENVQRLAQGKLRLRQVPGPANALGQVKFVFPNRHNVYLHDTPGRALFKASRRAFSHGCIRIADPMGLLMHVLRDEPEWTRERIDQAFNGPPATRITLRRPIPVFILYGTAMATEAGDTLFFDDIYSQDSKLARLLASRR
jgi:murein L,D-transpeptidase YcbB/YkuD